MQIQEFLHYQLFEVNNTAITVLNIILTIFLFFAAWLLQLLLRSISRKLVRTRKLDKGSSHSLFLIAKYLLWIIILLMALDTLGFKISILIASAAALLVGVGLGLQEFFKDVASGFIMLIERSLKVGDIVELDNHLIGQVIGIGIRTSKIKSRDNVMTIVPNSLLTNDKLINWSHIDLMTRFRVDVGVAYGTDIRLVEKVLLACALEHKQIPGDPPSFVRFNDFGDSSLNFQLFFWTEESFLAENIKSDLRFAIDDAFKKNGITIPFPQRDLHIKSDIRK